MESKIVPEEILDLHVMQEGEKMLSEITASNDPNQFALVRVKVCIVRYAGPNDWGNKTIIYAREGFTPAQVVKWKWFFRYRQALEQVKTPRQLVQLRIISYVAPDREKVLLNVLNNKLIAAKRERTKVMTAIEAGKRRAAETSLFSHEDDPEYLKAIEYLQKKQQRVEEIEAEIANLNKANQQT